MQVVDFTMADMALLHNYSTSTCYTLSRHPVLQTVWRINVPQIAFSFGFVMDAMLAMSALHLAFSKPAMKDHYVSQALRHHEAGLRVAAPLLPNITPDNCSALYVFAVLTCHISCAKPRSPGDFLLIGKDGISEWLVFLRGTRTIIDGNENLLRSDSVSPMFQIGARRANLREACSNTNQPFLVELVRLIEETSTDPTVLPIYKEALEGMSKSYTILSDIKIHGFESADVFLWLFRVSDDYLSLLSARTPEALAIFAYFCVLLKQLEWTWYMEGWSAHLIAGIWYSLDHEHRSWIQWPVEQIGWIPS